MNGVYISPASPAGIQMRNEMARRQSALGNANMAIPQGTQAQYADIAQKYAAQEAAKAVEAQRMGAQNALNDRRLTLSEGQLALESQRMALGQKMREQELANARATLDANRSQGRTLTALGGVGLAIDAANTWNTMQSAKKMDDIFGGMMDTAKQSGDANLAATIKMAQWFASNTGTPAVQQKPAGLTVPVLGGR